jgi:hypothetical protein
MAREQRTDVDYFPHECNHGRKMYIIEEKFGNDGYATWFKLLEQLGKSKNHYIDFSDDMTLMFLSSIFRIEQEKTIEILTYLSKVSAIDKYLFENHKIIYSQKFCDSITDAYRRRKTEMLQYDDILNEIKAKNAQTDGILTSKSEFSGQSVSETDTIIPKVEYSIVKDSKEEKSKEKERIGDESKKSESVILNDIRLKEIVEVFHSVCFELPRITEITEQRKKAILEIESKYGLEKIGQVFQITSQSDYLNGKVNNWIATFDWILIPRNFLKILENNYKNNGKTTSKKSNVEYSEDFLGKHLKNLQS